MFYHYNALPKNTKVVIRSSDLDTFFDIVAGDLQRDTIASLLLIICLGKHTVNVNRSNERKWFTLNKKSRQYPAETTVDADHTNNVALLANTPVQDESLMHSLEQITRGIGLHVKLDKKRVYGF